MEGTYSGKTSTIVSSENQHILDIRVVVLILITRVKLACSWF
ncbi:unnamed protein product [Larinioides sclopetarius]|uniref:Uncharacterized protein n=1 Tax=Larinioides sclopetarius TaxID=280406 RepID=A0AAV2BK13_9ARAC